MIRLLVGDCRAILKTLPDESVQCVVTSPPYFGLRDYGVDGQIGLEASPDAYVATLVAVFREVRRVLRDDGTLWLNLGDSYSAQGGGGLKTKDLIGIPWRVAFALQADGWWLRSDIIWVKPNPMPESVKDRPTSAHEHVFLLAKRERYFYDGDVVREPYNEASVDRYKSPLQFTNTRLQGHQPGKAGKIVNEVIDPNPLGRNLRNVWTIASQPFSGAHFATFPPALVEPCVKAGCPVGGVVLDPFAGAGTTGLVADRLQRDAVLIELNPAYAGLATSRITADAPLFAQVE